MQLTKLIFATNNPHKADEIKHIVSGQYRILTLAEAEIVADIPEPYDTLEENANGKADFIYKLTGENCFSEDTGLEVKALNGEPGVHSARYASDQRNFADNIHKLLVNMKEKSNREAQFKTVISLLLNGKRYLFEGVCKGSILNEIKGEGGFGYDAVFVPEGSNKTFAEMTMEEKNTFSHRRKATDKLIAFLKSNIS